MITTRRVRPNRTTGLGRILVAALILSALLAAVPPPAQAAPAGADAARLIAPLAGLMSWIEGLLADLGFSAAASESGPEAAFLPEACNMDPSGGNCSQGANSPVLAVSGGEKDLSDRPTLK